MGVPPVMDDCASACLRIKRQAGSPSSMAGRMPILLPFQHLPPRCAKREILGSVLGLNPDQPYLDWAAGVGDLLNLAEKGIEIGL